MRDINLSVARSLLERLGGGAPAEQVAELASEDMVLEVQGDPATLPWIGRVKHGRRALADFVEQQRELIRPDSFEVEDVLASEDRAVIVGALSSTLKATGRTLSTQFAIVLTISEGRISRFQLLEDSFAVSQAMH